MKTFCHKCKKYTTVIIKIHTHIYYEANRFDEGKELIWSDTRDVEVDKIVFICASCGYKTKNQKQYKDRKQ